MEPSERWDRLIDGLRSGDPRILVEFCREYGPALERVADRQIGDRLRQRVGPESVVQSACRTFLRRAGEGQFQLADRDGLWRLLCAITLTKVREQVRYHRRQKRGVDQEVRIDAASADGGPSPLHQMASAGPSPLEATLFADQLEQVFGTVRGDEERRILELKLQDLDNRDVASELGCSERTVRRVLGRIRERLERTLAVA